MINGKFYTGLPPNMIDRGNPQRNRLQSSIFWPDDTKTDSALETRVKRRNSLQIAQAERPPLRMQSSRSSNVDTDVNTRQLFQKEFSKSSIEFLDNLCDETKPRKPFLLRGNSTEVTPKPTALKLPLPENVVNAGYNTAKKKQAFTSKIEFNDYMGDELNNRNNLRCAKMDMNDKKEMERNTKNSPKLQVKNNMRNLSANEKLYPAERRIKVEVERVANRILREDADITPNNNGNAGEEFDEEIGGSGKGYHARDNRLTNKRFRERDLLENRRTMSPEYGYRRERRNYETYEDDYEVPDYAPNTRYGVPVRRSNSVGRFTSPPKRILKNHIRERKYHDDYANDGYRSNEGYNRYRYRGNDEEHESKDYNDPDFDVDNIEGRMKNMRMRILPKKHVTYSDDTYSHDDEMPSQSQRRAQPRSRTLAALPNMRTGNNQQRQQQQQQHQELQRYNSEMDLVEDANEALEQTFMENDMHDNETTTTTTTAIKSLNSGSSYNTNKNNNRRGIGNEDRYSLVNKITNNSKNNLYNNTTSRLNNQTISSAARKITPKTPTAATTKQNADTTATEPLEALGNDMKKHLRSSLCLHNGEIIASDDGGGTTSAKAPTRNARSIATRQRISVGLPD